MIIRENEVYWRTLVTEKQAEKLSKQGIEVKKDEKGRFYMEKTIGFTEDTKWRTVAAVFLIENSIYGEPKE